MIFSVSTVKDTVSNVEKFVRRNIGGGIDHLVIFLDAEQPEVAAFLLGHPNVTCIQADSDWWHGKRPDDLNERQWRNATEVVHALAPYDWAEWVFHIDGDEVVHLDRAVLDALPPRISSVILPPREVVALWSWDGEPTWFKTLLDDDQLELLKVIGLLDRAQNRAYFRGHLAGKAGVRPSQDIRFAVHRGVKREDGVKLRSARDPALWVLHYDSPDGREFVRKWQALAAAGGTARRAPARAVIGRAVQALLALDLPPDQAEPYLKRIFEVTRLDHLDDLKRLRLVHHIDPDAWTRTPEPFPRGAKAHWVRSMDNARRRPKDEVFARIVPDPS